MTFTVEILLRGQEGLVSESVSYEVEPKLWTDEDVRQGLEMVLRQFDRAQQPDSEERAVQLRGFSWIVSPVEQGVVIAIEMASGAIVAGPFEVDSDRLTQAITRVMASASIASSQVH